MILRNKFLHVAFTSLFSLALAAQTTPQLTYFDLREVRLLPGIFKHAEDLDLHYLLEMDPDRLLAPFLREAKLPIKKESYSNWENTGLDGHIGGHYLSALAHMYASTGDLRIKERLDYMLANLKRCQEANGNGYIGGVPGGKLIWTEVQQGNINAGSFNLNGKWVPLYNIHKTYAGLRDAYLLTGSKSAKDMLIKMTDWALKLVGQLSEAQIQEMLRSEHGGLNETFADVAAITQNKAYLELAGKFSHQSILEPLLQHKDHLTGLHANTQIPKVLGFKRIADLSHNEKWAEAVRYFWDNVVEQRSIAIGGNSVSEHFNPTDDFSKMLYSIEGPETCNTYNMLRLTKMLYQTDPQGKYLDFYERALYNHILSTQHPEHGGLVYFTQIRPGHYRVYSQTQTSMWCCVGSGMENHAKYGEMIYAQRNNDLFINLFIPSQLNWKEKGIEVVQETDFPMKANTSIQINPKKPASFSLFIRKPNWFTAAPHVLINGKPYHNFSSTNEHIQIKRTWRKGDIVSLELPMGVHTEQLPDKSNYYSILYGPIVLGARTGQEDLLGLQADDSRMGHIASGKQIPLRNLPILKAEPNHIPALVKPIASKPLHFTLSNLYLGKKGIQMELEPFFGIHDSRYMIYWPQATEKELQALQEKMSRDEVESLALAAKTVDKVVAGEQQPESDHFFRDQNSNAGAFGDTRWRETKDWFSYNMKITSETKLLSIKFIADNSSSVTEVIIDGKTISTLKDKDEKSTIKTIRINLPEDRTDKNKIELKIKAGAGSTSHKILEARTLLSD
ncbi:MULTISPECIES: glycoside hydrolase family 127 protein [unclassified Sphingobacterium]|uniref:glycoside hydrolase family 127 protein n=1 Tax=unclassified Sphingobacterium TaxID=2609468 RepID=UPI0025F8DEA1|nr:glycoside hydrolase family 127 protein [Sphingobacterium sp. UBA5670]